MSTEAGETPTKPPRGPMSRWAAVRFVVTFLVLTALLLTAGRYAINTSAMNWYLFQVARQASFVLGVVGTSSSVETPSAYDGRAEQMRAEMDAWRRGEDPTPGARGGAATPLSAYEAWSHRALRLGHDLRTERRYLALTDPLPAAAGAVTFERVAQVRASYDRLRASTTRGGGPMAMQVAPDSVKQSIASVGPLVDALARNAQSGGVVQDATVMEVESYVEQARTEQREFLSERVARITTQIQDRLGPQVSFVARSSETPPPRFTFSLVPDCGALPSMSIFLAALIAFPAPLRKRILGLIAGVPILYGINLARLVCLAVIGAYWSDDPGVFEFAHQYVWQSIYVLIVVGVWLLWVELIVRPGTSWRTNPTSAA
ncbi:MAG: archaeosortase/exosortase family protein [Candidatus Hydrogenedentes bacterium]|nr:archaeosortase/exosortase family protein [Candidatus Hydrogenedentota bacterium]